MGLFDQLKIKRRKSREEKNATKKTKNAHNNYRAEPVESPNLMSQIPRSSFQQHTHIDPALTHDLSKYNYADLDIDIFSLALFFYALIYTAINLFLTVMP